jgi:hypothetical protein
MVRVAFGQIAQWDRYWLVVPRGYDRLACGEVSDERAERGGGMARRWIGADSVGQRRPGQDMQEPGRVGIVLGDGEGLQHLATRDAGTA